MFKGRRSPGSSEALLLSALLLLYSNGLTAWALRRGWPPEKLFLRINPSLLMLMLAYAWRRGGLGRVGLSDKGLAVSAGYGTGLGLALSLPPVLFFRWPILLDTPLEYGPVSEMSRRALLMDLFVRVPLSIALVEELAFRGLLYTALRREMPAPKAVGISAAAFAGWHFAVAAATTQQTNLHTARLPRFLRPYVQPLAVLGGMLSTGLAGAAFAILRERTGNLAGPIIAHWLVDGIMIAALWRKSTDRKADRG